MKRLVQSQYDGFRLARCLERRYDWTRFSTMPLL